MFELENHTSRAPESVVIFRAHEMFVEIRSQYHFCLLTNEYTQPSVSNRNCNKRINISYSKLMLVLILQVFTALAQRHTRTHRTA